MPGSRKRDINFRRDIHEINDLYHYAPCGYHSIDRNGIVVRINSTELKWLGYASEEVVGKMSINDLLTPGGREIFRSIFPEFKSKGYANDIELELLRKDGTSFPVILSATAIYDENGEFQMSRTTVFDITRRKQLEKEMQEYRGQLEELVEMRTAELHRMNHELEEEIAERTMAQQALDNSESKFRLLLDHMKEGYQVIGPDWRYIYLNDAAALQYRRPKETLIGKTVSESWPGINQTPVYQLETDCMINRTPHQLENEFVFPDGSTGWFDLSIQPVPEGILIMSTDITERKLAEISLREQEEQYRLLFLNNPQPMWIYDLETLAFLEVNEAAVMHYGYSFDEFRNMTLRDIRPAEDVPMLESDVATTRNRINNAGIWRHRKKNGEIIHVEIVSHFTHYAGRRARHVMVIDVTEKMRSEAELIIAKEMAQESERLKSAFLANMSHEIRTPLNSILGFTELNNDPDTSEEEREQYSRIIMQSGKQLLTIISDIVDFSKIEAGSIILNKCLISVPNMVDDLMTIFHPMAAEKGLELVSDIPATPSEVTLVTDKNRLMQVLSNLLSNAIKFTDQGSVILGFTLGSQHLDFFIKDSGIGIAPEHQELIFERFRQVEQAHSRKLGGTGLGLTISKSLAEKLGGGIRVNSIPGAGSTFILSLPR